ncbi:phage portal protein, HK97 family [Sphingomonas laterariae]|uniref:Phage portal protein, HK97 family n=1 Tax=Edaphosphingomonas laterariae TaxID=861865 RepID=A0A239C9U9_9SPHN|nr:phage portal protein [Sphingomonas laterariae]SNS16401.1 phage portal protein, HK97 family [Sphingomonas laterariae]
MRLFGWKSGSAAMRPALAQTMTGWVADGRWPRGYDEQVREAVLANPVAQRAVRLVGESVASLTWIATGGPEAATGLIRPVAEAIASHLLLHGNAFLSIGCGGQGDPIRLHALRPERVTVETDGQGWPASYRYQVGQAVQRLDATDALGKPGVIHLRTFHPTDDQYGLGCLSAAAGAVAIHNAATRWNKALLDNAARPSGAIVFDPGDRGAVLSREQFDRLKAEMEASFAGSGNAGRPMLLEGGVRWQSLSLTPADMDFVSLKANAAREIALAFGVPPLMLGQAGDNTYANYAEANRAFWRLTVLPMGTRIAEGIASVLRAWWPELAIEIDMDRIIELHGDREPLWRMAMGADFLSDDEKREMLGFARRAP